MYPSTALASNQIHSAWTFDPSYPTDLTLAQPGTYANIGPGTAHGREPLQSTSSLSKAQPLYHELNGVNEYNVPSPPQVDHPFCDIQIHPLLAVGTSLRFDLSRRPSEPYQGVFSVAATFPSLPSLAIIVPSIPWPIVIQPSTGFATIGDVLTALWETLQTDLDKTSSSKSKIHNSGRRLDLLGGVHSFAGISSSSLGEDTFLLHLEP